MALILAQTQEICEAYDVDGFWYDICNTYPPCYCETCRAGMAEQGVDVDDDEAVATSIRFSASSRFLLRSSGLLALRKFPRPL